MRIAYQDDLDAFSHDLIIMCDQVHAVMTTATHALLTGSLEPAEDALSMAEGIAAIRVRCTDRAVELLALQGPVAGDLRQVVSSIHIVENFDRMTALAMHIARLARSRHPTLAVPRPLLRHAEEFGRLVHDMSGKIRDVLVAPDAEAAFVLAEDDDAVDDLNEYLLTLVTQRAWPHSAREAVDVAMLCRFYERYADHCVSVAARIVYLSTGLMPEQYRVKREREETNTDLQARFAQLERLFPRDT